MVTRPMQRFEVVPTNLLDSLRRLRREIGSGCFCGLYGVIRRVTQIHMCTVGVMNTALLAHSRESERGLRFMRTGIAR